MLSQLAVFKDIIPGYRIRALTSKEREEKVSQMVARTRDWEQGLVVVYQAYLRSLDQELKGKSNLILQCDVFLPTQIIPAKTSLAEVALQCMCTLLVEVTHFNFRTNLIGSIVSRLSKKSWDQVRK
jgi:nucleolar complex protein 3